MNIGEMTSGASFASLGLPPDLSKSPSSPEFLGDEEAASTCPLLTPSPPAVLGYEQALSSPDVDPGVTIDFEIGDEEIINADSDQPLKGEDAVTVDSSSSGSSAQEPTACVQLIPGQHHLYQQLAKATEGCTQENGTATMPLTFDLTREFFFTTWNWPIIRKSCAWTVVSALVGMFCMAIAMVVTLPKECEPEHMWWQTATVYEIFPASFQDSDNDGVGDLAGLTSRVGYLHSLGVSAVRLNSIFLSEHYPEGYEMVQSLTALNPKLGTMEHMKKLVRSLHHHNISLILDLPVDNALFNDSSSDPVVDAMHFWISHKVNGFYLKGADQLNVEQRAVGWRQAVGSGRLLVSPPGASCKVCDLEHVPLNIAQPLQPQLEQAGSSKALWSLGQNQRLADGLSSGPIGALLLLMALPGTPSLLYGDEVGLKGVHGLSEEHEDLQHMRQLPPMVWASPGFSGPAVLPWLPTAATLLQEETERRDARLALAHMAALRMRAPQLYMSGQTRVQAEDSNFAVRYADADGVIAVERWYPRRHVLVAVSNLGPRAVHRDLSSLYYGGRVVVSYPAVMQDEYVRFRDFSIAPGQTLVVELDK